MIKFLSSPRITVVCLFLLFILTFWGTIAQVQQGLYVAQERYFNSFLFLAAGFIPFPGAQLVLWVFFVNLICSIILTFRKYAQWANSGLLIIHVGLILYFVAAFLIFHVSRESTVHLAEGEGTNVSTSYQDWELAYWNDSGNDRLVTAFDTKYFKGGFQIPFTNKDFTLTVNKFYLNSNVLNDSSLVNEPLVKEKEQNIEGGVFDLKVNHQSYPLILYGDEGQAVPVTIRGKRYYFMLRHKHFPLPFAIRLDHFKAEFHPGTNVAKSFESLVTISTGSLERQVRIFMNNPLRYKDYTIYQASYDTDSAGRQYSSLAVVKNFARILPYIACFVVFFGLALHFFIQAFMSRPRV
jgi:hypothetical protein